MSDYNAVAPPAAPIDTNAAFADALQRARQIAAKIGGSGTGAPPGTVAPPVPASAMPPIGIPGNVDLGGMGIKRPLEDAEGEPDSKKLAAKNDPIGAQLAALAQQARRHLGNGNQDEFERPGQSSLSEEYAVPDKLVGLVIGRGGEQITRLQAESGCKIQIAQDSGGLPDRMCTLTGNPQAIERAKALIDRIIERGQGPAVGSDGGLGDGNTTIELMIPSNKVGLVIGKGGEMIKKLQERAGVKMVMIQDATTSGTSDKPLRVSGDPQKCKHARELVNELIGDKDNPGMEMFGERMDGGYDRERDDDRDFERRGGRGDYGPRMGGPPGGGGGFEMLVPRFAVGIVIGRGGDMIKKIQNETGARIQFRPDDGHSPERLAVISGSDDKIDHAREKIDELIDSARQKDEQRRQGGGRDRGFGPPPHREGGRGGGGGGFRGGPPDRMDSTTFTVPSSKCGLVIGKGGETIRNINMQSGAHVELSRNLGPPGEKVFTIRGSPQQISCAQQLIHEKVSGDLEVLVVQVGLVAQEDLVDRVPEVHMVDMVMVVLVDPLVVREVQVVQADQVVSIKHHHKGDQEVKGAHLHLKHLHHRAGAMPISNGSNIIHKTQVKLQLMPMLLHGLPIINSTTNNKINLTVNNRISHQTNSLSNNRVRNSNSHHSHLHLAVRRRRVLVVVVLVEEAAVEVVVTHKVRTQVPKHQRAMVNQIIQLHGQSTTVNKHKHSHNQVLATNQIIPMHGLSITGSKACTMDRQVDNSLINQPISHHHNR
uniref:Far upstream element-binding protein 2-like isoform X5 n=1 Tax=Saccoglossus kowalevskii TaxID=10224 RepID=A0ABM0MSP9_SACKO|nr:PREDICTED: far upstream element-binding protein 2-like isoform X5 [Saccoglossus kowalevskii]